MGYPAAFQGPGCSPLPVINPLAAPTGYSAALVYELVDHITLFHGPKLYKVSQKKVYKVHMSRIKRKKILLWKG